MLVLFPWDFARIGVVLVAVMTLPPTLAKKITKKRKEKEILFALEVNEILLRSFSLEWAD